MTIRYVDGTNGNDSWDGLAPNFVVGTNGPKVTWNGVEDTPVVAGDLVHFRPGTYRELFTVDVSGGNAYSTGTVSVTNGSAAVVGSGTAFTGNVAANYIFHVTVLASGTDGVTTVATATSHTFTSAAGNFQAGHIGQTIRINTIGAYIITAVASATSITVAKVDNSSFTMTAGTGLTYNVGPEAPYDILSVTDNTNLTLTDPWSGPTLTGLAYLTYNPVRFVGDHAGVIWPNPTNAVVRITGSDNDQTATRNNCISSTSKQYRSFSSFVFDTTINQKVVATVATGWLLQNCIFDGIGGTSHLTFSGASTTDITVQNCMFSVNSGFALQFTHSSAVDNSKNLVQNCLFVGTTGRIITIDRIGGITVKNCHFISGGSHIRVTTALTAGQTITVNNCTFLATSGSACNATAVGEITENYNTFSANATNRTNTNTGANSITYPPLFDPRWFFEMVSGKGRMLSPFDLASYSQLVNLAGTSPTTTDMRGTAVIGAQREWGALEYDPTLLFRRVIARQL